MIALIEVGRPTNSLVVAEITTNIQEGELCLFIPLAFALSGEFLFPVPADAGAFAATATSFFRFQT